ncbi:hypothetical protein BsWGS_28419 [Bradybaena similaris]
MAAGSALWSPLIFCILYLHVASQSCKEGWYYHAGSCYNFGESRVTWAAAQAICRAYGGKLAEIETPDENEFLKSIAKDKRVEYAFLGGTDIFGEGMWEWASTGDRISPFVDWAPDQPDDNTGQDCLGFRRDSYYQWNDDSCTLTASFICEAKSTDGPIVG